MFGNHFKASGSIYHSLKLYSIHYSLASVLELFYFKQRLGKQCW